MKPKIAVLDYGIGNLRSAQKALEHVGADARLDPDGSQVSSADAVVLPGVGAFGACMDALRLSGLDQVAIDAAASGRPFTGICVGMQLLFEGSSESPDVRGLGLIPGRIERIAPRGLPVPQMQWNELETDESHPLFEGMNGQWLYFVHSYAAPTEHPDVSAWVPYDGRVAAGVAAGTIAATQFHPEKSSTAGLRLLGNLCRWATAARS